MFILRIILEKFVKFGHENTIIEETAFIFVTYWNYSNDFLMIISLLLKG